MPCFAYTPKKSEVRTFKTQKLINSKTHVSAYFVKNPNRLWLRSFCSAWGLDGKIGNKSGHLYLKCPLFIELLLTFLPHHKLLTILYVNALLQFTTATVHTFSQHIIYRSICFFVYYILYAIKV